MSISHAFPNVYYDNAHRRYLAGFERGGVKTRTGMSMASCHAYILHCRYCLAHKLPYDTNFLSIAFDIANALPENADHYNRT